MTNPYLERLRGRIQEKQDPSQPSKPSKPGSEGFEGAGRRHFLENHCLDEITNTAAKNSKSATTADPQNLQNRPDGLGARVTIIAIPAEGLRFRRAYAHLQLRPPAYVEETRWRQCVADAKAFLRQWGSQAEELGWDSRSLFGLHSPPANPHPSYRRLGRYDATGLIWLLEGREVVALTEATAIIRNPVTGTITVYRRFNKPALGPLCDSLEDLK